VFSSLGRPLRSAPYTSHTNEIRAHPRLCVVLKYELSFLSFFAWGSFCAQRATGGSFEQVMLKKVFNDGPLTCDISDADGK
jgi:hypothetical protein